MNIVLTGYRGTGKTEVSKRLEALTGRARISTDELIVKTQGMTIPEIVERRGWDYFRDAESAVVEEVCARDGLIIDTGGGVILRAKNIQALKRGGVVFWLDAPAQIIRLRIGRDTQRPSLTGTQSFSDEIEKVLAERTPLYKETCDYRIRTDLLSAEQAAKQIFSFFETHTRVKEDL